MSEEEQIYRTLGSVHVKKVKHEIVLTAELPRLDDSGREHPWTMKELAAALGGFGASRRFRLKPIDFSDVAYFDRDSDCVRFIFQQECDQCAAGVHGDEEECRSCGGTMADRTRGGLFPKKGADEKSE